MQYLCIMGMGAVSGESLLVYIVSKWIVQVDIANTFLQFLIFDNIFVK